MAMITLRPADGQSESRSTVEKSEQEERTKNHKEEPCEAQNKFNAFRPWLSQTEKDSDSKICAADYGKPRLDFQEFYFSFSSVLLLFFWNS